MAHNRIKLKPHKTAASTPSQHLRVYASFRWLAADGTKQKKINFSAQKPNRTNCCQCRQRRWHTHASKQINSACIYIPHAHSWPSVENDACIYGRHEHRIKSKHENVPFIATVCSFDKDDNDDNDTRRTETGRYTKYPNKPDMSQQHHRNAHDYETAEHWRYGARKQQREQRQ